jgi:hypothetical protein
MGHTNRWCPVVDETIASDDRTRHAPAHFVELLFPTTTTESTSTTRPSNAAPPGLPSANQLN